MFFLRYHCGIKRMMEIKYQSADHAIKFIKSRNRFFCSWRCGSPISLFLF
jgi:hypothetical protein